MVFSMNVTFTKKLTNKATFLYRISAPVFFRKTTSVAIETDKSGYPDSEEGKKACCVLRTFPEPCLTEARTKACSIRSSVSATVLSIQRIYKSAIIGFGIKIALGTENNKANKVSALKTHFWGIVNYHTLKSDNNTELFEFEKDKSNKVTSHSFSGFSKKYSTMMSQGAVVNEIGNKDQCKLDDDFREVLPKKVVPSHYQIDITPGIEDGKGGHIFQGNVDIDISVKEATDVIKLNASSLTIEKIKISPYASGSESISVKEWSTDQEKETLTVKLSKELPVGTNWKLSIKYTGIHNDGMAGFYRVQVNIDGKKNYMFSTQFESRHCCKAIPCWDEPAMKSTFGVTLRVPSSMVSLSNMEAVTDSEKSISQDGKKVVKYKTTPKMSPYLLAFVVGHLDYLEAYTETKTLSGGEKTLPIKCRVYATSNYINKGKFALEIGCDVLSFFEEYFDVAYPLSKMEQVAIADFSAGAMENWGLVTYRETALLFDAASSSSRFKLRVATTVAHELAHQWFGNLVTMSWWNDLWLNEGFATFASILVLSKIHPEWQPFVEFVAGDLSSALVMDGLATTHAIDVPIHYVSDIDQIFDSISYSKGASIINMVHSYLGYDDFRKSLQHYIKKHMYSNTKSADIWLAFDEIAKKNLNKNMYNWIKKPGYPLLTVENEIYDENNKTITLTITQKRYYSSGVPSGVETDTIWWVPIVLVTHDGKKPTIIRQEMDSKSAKLTFPYTKSENSYWKLNAGTSGFYRVCLSSEQVNNLSKILLNDVNAMTVTDKMGLLSDTYAIAKSGEGSFTSLLNLIVSLRNETDFFVISSIAQVLSSLSHNLYLRPKTTVDAVNSLIKYMFTDKVKEVGYDAKPNESTLDSMKRSLIIGSLANAGDEQVLSELRTRFEKYVKGDTNALYSDIRDVTYSAILKYSTSPEKDLETMIDLYNNATSPDQFVVILASLGAINSNALVDKLINDSLLDKTFIRIQDTIYLFRSISAKNPDIKYANNALWKCTTENWETIHTRYASSIHLLGAIFTSTIDAQVGSDVANKIKSWINCEDLKDKSGDNAAAELRSKSLKVIKRDIEQAIEALEIRTKWVERDAPEIENWMKKRGYIKS